MTNHRLYVLGLLSLSILMVPPTVNAAEEECTLYDVTWSGVGYQFDNGHTWTVEMFVSDVPNGALAGTITYPSLGCGGMLTHVENQGEFYWFLETLTFGQDDCIDGGAIQVALYVDPEIPGSCELVWGWHWPNGEAGAAAILDH